ncbi:T9SS type A sorting domain-containing protein [Chitinophaga varians]|uniref:T9SS type A sorting domain-containing protein n=1 Tax=Chitinophaga varians TaxID=2202339 RepID=UPI00165F1B37|nr:T9SS type A sorting domain-containing protein [Chitinophaga varians]MBC9912544.1 T9SS type A sorting domain-containing protein [Chitinophaga varians]
MTSFISKCIIALMVLAALCTKANAQLILNRQVVGSNGGSGNLNQVLIQYTIGEPVMLPITNGQLFLTQGFQQPFELPPLPPGKSPVKSYILFPNPALTTVKVQFELLADAMVNILMLNTAGQEVYNKQHQAGQGKSTVVIPVNRFAAGLYTVVLKVGVNIYFEKLIVQ